MRPARTSLLQELQATAARLRHLVVERNRLDAARARADTRNWARERRERTRHLIELGGLVQKAGLVELVNDDRATLLGAFLELADRLQLDERQDKSRTELLARWRGRGLRTFDADADGQEGEKPSGRNTVPPNLGRSAP